MGVRASLTGRGCSGDPVTAHCRGSLESTVPVADRLAYPGRDMAKRTKKPATVEAPRPRIQQATPARVIDFAAAVARLFADPEYREVARQRELAAQARAARGS